MAKLEVTVDDDAPLFFPEEGANSEKLFPDDLWKVMVIDDDLGVHELTAMVLRRFQFEGRGLDLVSGYSGGEAQTLMRQHPDTAILLLDVVMERENAGLDVVRFVRECLKNHQVRIILRTGQPGMAPELEVITQYDINDYRDKTELTQEKLITAIVTGLRSFRDLTQINKHKMGLETVLKVIGDLFGQRSDKKLAESVLKSLDTILVAREDSCAEPSSAGFAAREENGGWWIYAGQGDYGSMVGQNLEDCASQAVMAMVESVRHSGLKLVFESNRMMAMFLGQTNTPNILFFQKNSNFNDSDGSLSSQFMAKAGLAFRSFFRNQEMFEAQSDLGITLGEFLEERTVSFGFHVRRVVYSSRLLGQKLGLSEEEIEWLGVASGLHDLGKALISDQTLKKTGPLSPEELKEVRTHSGLGFQMLKGGKHKGILMGATVANQHHERWDGKGYPQGLRGEEIHIFSRIVALVDVFDAMIHDRPYRKGRSREEALAFIRESRGTFFDPKLVDLLFAYLPEFLAIQDKIPDKGGFLV